MELKIEYVPIDSIKPYEKNARKHEKIDINAIVASIQEFGFDDPIGLWGDNNSIVEGHGRFLAAQKLGMKEVPCIRLDHLSDEQRRAYALAHNKTAELSVWDFDVLGGELDDIFNIDMSKFGFDNNTIDDDEIDEGEIEDKSEAKVAVKIIFQNAKQWKGLEEKVREFVDDLENVSVSVGEYEDQ